MDLIVAGVAGLGIAVGAVIKAWHTHDRSKSRHQINQEFREEVHAVIKPALLENNHQLLHEMNGIYLRTAEARVEFKNIKEDLTRVKDNQHDLAADVKKVLVRVEDDQLTFMNKVKTLLGLGRSNASSD